MSRPPHARARVLDAFESLLVDEGERSTALDAVARAAGVSKGGLLYHFASRDALDDAMIERLRVLAEEDVELVGTDPRGPVGYFLATSGDVGTPLDRAISAVSRLAGGGNAKAAAALSEVRAAWAEALRPHVRDQAALDLVMLVSDGLYMNSAMLSDISGPVPAGASLDRLIRLVEDTTRR